MSLFSLSSDSLPSLRSGNHFPQWYFQHIGNRLGGVQVGASLSHVFEPSPRLPRAGIKTWHLKLPAAKAAAVTRGYGAAVAKLSQLIY